MGFRQIIKFLSKNDMTIDKYTLKCLEKNGNFNIYIISKHTPSPDEDGWRLQNSH